MFTRITMIGAYIFLLIVLLPHTAWMFSLFEPEQSTNLGWSAAVAFEITIAVLTHFLATQLAAVSDMHDEKFTARLKRELVNIPAFLLLGSVAISTVANWTHAYNFSTTIPFADYGAVKFVYSLLFGAALPLCSFAYAYVLSLVYRKAKDESNAFTDEAKAWLALTNHLQAKPGEQVTPRLLGRMAGVTEEVAAKVITKAVNIGTLNNNGKV